MSRPSDIDLMMYADGELDAKARAEVDAWLAKDASARMKVAALGEVGDMIRTGIELEVDDAETDLPDFQELWGAIEKGIANPPAPGASALPKTARAQASSWLAPLPGWFENHRAHVLTGVLSAGAAAAVLLLFRVAPPTDQPSITRVSAPPAVTQPVGAPPCPTTGPLTADRVPEVESLEVYGGSGTVFTVPGDDADDSAATVIWISQDDKVEDPI